jgi:heptosyltransferase III
VKIDGGYLVCHKPNHDWPNRNLPDHFWIDFLKKLAELTGKTIVQVGSSKDFALENTSNIYDHRGLYDLQKLAALIDMSCGFVGVDAGPSHIAASTNTPIFTFYTCAHHEARMPLRDSGIFIPITPNINCYGCMQRVAYPRPGYFCETGDNKCVEAFSVIDTVELIKDAISQTS